MMPKARTPTASVRSWRSITPPRGSPVTRPEHRGTLRRARQTYARRSVAGRHAGAAARSPGRRRRVPADAPPSQIEVRRRRLRLPRRQDRRGRQPRGRRALVPRARHEGGGAAAGPGKRTALRYWIGAIRETFEEAGLLLAVDAAGRDVDITPPRFADHRKACHRDNPAFWAMVRGEHLQLATD